MPAQITRCPACATMFKVVPDQLRVSEGWVRCGHCGEIFDAGAHLQDAAAVAQAQSASVAAHDDGPAPWSPAGADDASPDSSVDAADDSAGLPSEAPSESPSDLPSELASDVPSESGADSSLLPSQVDDDAPEPDPAELAAQARILVEDPRDRPFELRREDLSRPAELTPSLPEPRESHLEAEPAAGEPTFMVQARRDARWQHPAVRALLLLAALGLLALLALQVAVQEHDRLAAAEPALRPWLASVCAAAGCRIAPPRQIDAIAIDSSSFTKAQADTYRLQVTLKNQSRAPIAMPALELTLTDSDEQPVVRRVLLPGDFGAGRAAIGAAGEWSGSVGIAVTDNSLAGRVAGYRLLAFYP